MAAVVVALPFSIKYALAEPEDPPPVRQDTAGTQDPDASAEPDTDTQPEDHEKFESTETPDVTEVSQGPTDQEPSPIPDKGSDSESEVNEGSSGITYVLNKNTKKFHHPDCSSVQDMSPKNREDSTASRDDIIAMGYSPCGRCKP